MSTPPTPARPSASEPPDAASASVPPQVRVARPEELEVVGALTATVYVGDGFLAAGDGYVAELRDTRRRAREAEVWVAVQEGRLLGSVTFCPAGSAFREIARDGEGEFRMLAVSPAARGRGVGRLLVEQVLRRSAELGYHAVRMSTMDRMAGAHRVYERLGFTRVPEDDWEPEPGVRLLAYVLPLTRG